MGWKQAVNKKGKVDWNQLKKLIAEVDPTDFASVIVALHSIELLENAGAFANSEGSIPCSNNVWMEFPKEGLLADKEFLLYNPDVEEYEQDFFLYIYVKLNGGLSTEEAIRLTKDYGERFLGWLTEKGRTHYLNEPETFRRFLVLNSQKFDWLDDFDYDMNGNA